MRVARLALFGVVALSAGLLGCVNSQPNLKPPTQPEVLATPGARDKRYGEPGGSYPSYVLSNDEMKQQLTTGSPQPVRTMGKGAAMGTGSGGFAPNGF